MDPPWANVRDLALDLPPGLIGNLTEFPACSDAVFLEQVNMITKPELPTCPAESQVGILSPGLSGLLAFPPGVYRTPLYNLGRPDGDRQVIARLGAIVLLYPVFIDIRLDPERDYALKVELVNAPAVAGISAANTTVWGVPAAHSHDIERFNWLEALVCSGQCTPHPATSGNPIALMSNSTACGPAVLGLEATSYADPRGGDYQGAPLAETGECADVPFDPSLSLRPTTPRAGAASGVHLSLRLPQTTVTNPNGIRTADVRQAVVRLPQGMTINSGAGDGLGSCSEAEIGFDPNEHQIVDFGAGGGPLILAFEGQATSELPYLATAQEVQAALEALPNVANGDLQVSGRPGGPWRVTFGGSLAGRDVPTITGFLSEVERLSIRAEGGLYRLTYNGQTTESLPFDADADAVRAALEALPAIRPGEVNVRGGFQKGGSVFRIAFRNALARTNVPDLKTTNLLSGTGSFIKAEVLAQGGSAVQTAVPAQGGGLHFDGSAPTCPEASKIASGELSTPLLHAPLRASLYLASRDDNPFDSLMGGYLVASGDGVVVKIAVRFDVEPSGRVSVSFDNIPQLPIGDLELDFKNGNRGIVTTPAMCGQYTSDWELAPWSGAPPSSGTSRFSIDENCEGDGTPPDFNAGSSSALAGSFTSFGAEFRRDPRSAALTRVSVASPPGLTAKLADVPACSEATVEAVLAGAPESGPEAAACPGASQVGTATAGVGSGAPFYLDTGAVYLAGPYKGAPLSMLVVDSLSAGPFDFGDLAVRVAVYVDPVTAQAHAVSDPFPTAVDGIPIDVRDLRVSLDRPGFVINPTDCEERSVTGTVARDDGSELAVADRFQVGSCADLGFSPAVRVLLGGAVGRNGHPRIRVEIKPRPGDANISGASFALPAGELLDPRAIGDVCARGLPPERCPHGSKVGSGRVWSPTLGAPLAGPIYLRRPLSGFPDLIADLRSGEFRILLYGHTAAGAGRLRVVFPAIPDIPFSRAVIKLEGGPSGLLVNSEALCARPGPALAGFTAHNGRGLRLRSPIHVHGSC